MKTIFSIFILLCSLNLLAQNKWAEQNYKKGTFLIYSGSGAFTRHLERNYFNSNYDLYLKSPFIVLGTDYCFGATSDAYWGAGIYLSGGIGKKEISSVSERKTWFNTLAAVHITHHSKWFVTKKVDLCSGYLIGIRYKNYDFMQASDAVIKYENSTSFAAGITATLKYYFSKKISVHCQGALGYNVDLLNVGLSFKINQH